MLIVFKAWFTLFYWVRFGDSQTRKKECALWKDLCPINLEARTLSASPMNPSLPEPVEAYLQDAGRYLLFFLTLIQNVLWAHETT